MEKKLLSIPFKPKQKQNFSYASAIWTYTSIVHKKNKLVSSKNSVKAFLPNILETRTLRSRNYNLAIFLLEILSFWKRPGKIKSRRYIKREERKQIVRIIPSPESRQRAPNKACQTMA